MNAFRKAIDKTVIFFIFCFLFFMPLNSQEKTPAPYLIYVKEIINSFVKEVKKEYKLECVGSGGSMPYDVCSITVLLSIDKRANINEARKLGLIITRKLINKINSHEKIRPYLHQYPFTDNNVWVSISFRNPKKGTHFLDGSVATAGFLEGDVFYTTAKIHKIHDPGLICGKTGKYLRPPKEVEDETLVTILKETYEEAEAIVEREKQANL